MFVDLNRLVIARSLLGEGMFVANTVTMQKSAPSEIHLLPIGKWEGYFNPLDGKSYPFEITTKHVTAAANYHERRLHRNPDRKLVIDYEHQTMYGGEAPAAGWISKLQDRGSEGLWGTGVDWTPKAKSHIEAGEYKYLSPVFKIDATDRVTGGNVLCALYNAALTNEPFLDELRPLVAKDNNSLSLFIIAKENVMDDLLERLRYFLQLPITAMASDIVNELNKLIGQLKDAIAASTADGTTAKAVLDYLQGVKQKLNEHAQAIATRTELFGALGLQPTASLEEAKGLIVAGRSNATTLQTVTQELSTLKGQVTGQRFNDVIAKGVASGRITPAQKADQEWMNAQRAWFDKNPQTFEEYFTAKAPQIVPLNQIRVDGAVPVSQEDPAVVAKAAQDYVGAEAKLGRTVSFTDAVNHVMKKKPGS